MPFRQLKSFLKILIGVQYEFLAVGNQGAVTAVRISGGAAVPTEEDDPVAEVAAFFRRQDGAQLPLYLLRFLAVRQAKSSADADAVGVADHAARHAVQVTQQKIGGFPAYPGDFQQDVYKRQVNRCPDRDRMPERTGC